MFVLGAKNNACVRLHLSRLTMKEFLLFMSSGDVDLNAILSQTRKIFLPLSVFWAKESLLQTSCSSFVNCCLFSSLLKDAFQSAGRLVFSPFLSPHPRLFRCIVFTDPAWYMSVLNKKNQRLIVWCRKLSRRSEDSWTALATFRENEMLHCHPQRAVLWQRNTSWNVASAVQLSSDLQESLRHATIKHWLLVVCKTSCPWYWWHTIAMDY